MRPGEDFENECYNHLRKKYGNIFCHEGGMDSTKSDIAVIKNNHVDFYIEVKDTVAQSGQFVLVPDEANEEFVFSSRNKSKSNDITELIINYINQDFNRFNRAGTAGEPLDIDSDVFSNWIIGNYSKKM
ncbi:MAG: hypothetical protein ACI4KF_06975 [Huintestinicola sp.]